MEFITLTISAQTLGTIGAGLQELPYKLANPALQEIDRQVKQYLEQKGRENDRGKSSEVGDSDGHADGAGQGYIDQDRQPRREAKVP